MLLYGADDALESDGADKAGDADRFLTLLDARTVEGAGHFLHRGRPDAVLAAL